MPNSQFNLSSFPLISVVMPVFNAQETLEIAIKSLLLQTYSNWELLCINDGSSDSSEDILIKYQNEDGRIRYWNQKNSGPTAARMLAYNYMQGDYVYLLDSDDTISTDLLEKSLQAIQHYKADAAVPQLMVQRETGDYYCLNKYKPGHLLSGQEAFQKTFPWQLSTFCLWSRQVVVEAIKELDISVNNYNTDEFLSRLKLLKSKIVVISEGTHYYNYNFSSITKKFSPKTLLALETNVMMINYAKSKNMPEKVLRLIYSFQLRTIGSLLKNLYRYKKQLEHSDFLEAHKFIEDHYKKNPSVFLPIIDQVDFILKTVNLIGLKGIILLAKNSKKLLLEQIIK